MSREVDLSQKLSEEDRDYLLARGREQQVFQNDAQFTGDPEAVRQANYIPGTSIDRAEGVPATPNGDRRVVMGGGEVETDEDGDELEDTPDSAEHLGDSVDGETEDNYESWSKKQLSSEIAKRNEDLPEDEQIPVTGSKPELIARLRENDEEEAE